MKVNTTSSIKSTGMSEKQIDALAQQTGKEIAEGPKVKVRIPELPGEIQPVECCINGYNYIICRGQTVELPEAVVQLLSNAGIV
ncbi:hypothetical protein LJC55_00215 [Eubacteriales bacterium OttesenSCG-928-N14]|nr:hypothetical protein [Eubacteriales bacterium OttesenSCG-928-N14]